MLLEKVDSSWLGKKIRIYVGWNSAESEFFVSTVPTNHTAEVFVIGYPKPGFKPSMVIGSPYGVNGLPPRGVPGTSNLYVHDHQRYTFGKMIVLPIEIAGVCDTVPVTNCRKCKNENTTGVSNSPDGTYICRQCSIFAHIFGSNP